jgi:hypothetical protein
MMSKLVGISISAVVFEGLLIGRLAFAFHNARLYLPFGDSCILPVRQTSFTPKPLTSYYADLGAASNDEVLSLLRKAAVFIPVPYFNMALATATQICNIAQVFRCVQVQHSKRLTLREERHRQRRGFQNDRRQML